MTERIEARPPEEAPVITAADRRREGILKYVPTLMERNKMREVITSLMRKNGLLDKWELIELGKASIDADGEDGTLVVHFKVENRT